MSGIDPENLMPVAMLRALVRTVPDFPVAGIQFRDVTTLIADADGFAATLEHLHLLAAGATADVIVGIDARGFIFGAALAKEMGLGFVPVRKAGKLPGATISRDYALEYGTDRLEIHDDVLQPGQRVLLVDDLIATGGTAVAATELIKDAGGIVAKALFVIDLPDLGGAKKLREINVDVHALMEFEGD